MLAEEFESADLSAPVATVEAEDEVVLAALTAVPEVVLVEVVGLDGVVEDTPEVAVVDTRFTFDEVLLLDVGFVEVDAFDDVLVLTTVEEAGRLAVALLADVLFAEEFALAGLADVVVVRLAGVAGLEAGELGDV